MRTFVYDLAVHTSTWGATSLFVGEYTAEEIATLSEFAIADGIIRLSNRRQELRAIREVEVLKLRGANVVTGAHFFEIGGDGLTFFPRVRSPEEPFAEPETPDERAPTGIRRARRDVRRRPAAGELDGGAGRDRNGQDASRRCSSCSRARATESRGSTSRSRRRRISSAASPRASGGICVRSRSRGSSPSATSLPSSSRPTASSMRRGSRWSGSERGAPCSTA